MKHLRDPYTGKEIWRLTDDPAVNHTHLYHNVDAFSGEGRYVAYGTRLPHFGNHPTETPHVYAYDLADGSERCGHPGVNPVWNPRRPELVFSWQGKLFKWDAAADILSVLAEMDGILPGSVERRGQWALCYYGWSVDESRIDRVAMDGSGRMETVHRAAPGEYLVLPKANPARDICHVRRLGKGPRLKDWTPGSPPARDQIVPLNMMFMGTDGSDPHPVSTRQEWHHHNWSGDGDWYMLGPYWKRAEARPEEPWQHWGLMDGLNHQGHCGLDGRFICGDVGNQLTFIFDLVHKTMHRVGTPMSSSVPYTKMSDPHPIGSPDGTKFVFDSMYDLEHAPVTTLAEPAWPADDALTVESTEGFPDSGTLVAGNIVCGPEFVQYGHKDATRFLACRRGAAPVAPPESPFRSGRGLEPTLLVPGVAVAPYEAMHLEPGVHREPDVYVQVIRPPEHPLTVRAAPEENAVRVSWAAPENRREIRTYRVWRNEEAGNWKAIGEVESDRSDWSDDAAPAGAARYAVTSVEWSGLESDRSATAAIPSRDGQSLPAEILLPAGEAGPVPGAESTGAHERLHRCFDDQAYNHRSLPMQNGLGAARFTFFLPMPAKAVIDVHVKSPDGTCAQLNCRVNDESFSTYVDVRSYAWCATTVDDRGQEAAVELLPENCLTISAPMSRVYLDQVRIRLVQ